jgi:hypothetical protein
MSNQNKLVTEVVELLSYSGMEAREERMWLALLQNMDQAQLTKFREILQKEKAATSRVYLNKLKTLAA